MTLKGALVIFHVFFKDGFCILSHYSQMKNDLSHSLVKRKNIVSSMQDYMLAQLTTCIRMYKAYIKVCFNESADRVTIVAHYWDSVCWIWIISTKTVDSQSDA